MNAERGHAHPPVDRTIDKRSRDALRAELTAAARDLRGREFTLGDWGCLDVPLAEWLEATAGRIGFKSWTGSRQALRVARMINGRAR